MARWHAGIHLHVWASQDTVRELRWTVTRSGWQSGKAVVTAILAEGRVDLPPAGGVTLKAARDALQLAMDRLDRLVDAPALETPSHPSD